MRREKESLEERTESLSETVSGRMEVGALTKARR